MFNFIGTLIANVTKKYVCTACMVYVKNKKSPLYMWEAVNRELDAVFTSKGCQA